MSATVRRARVLAILAMLALPRVAIAAEPEGKSETPVDGPAGEGVPAAVLVLVNGNLLAMYQIVSGQSQCFVYTYDHNGNRLTRSNLNPGHTATWGSAVYGCSNWTVP